MIQAIYHEAIYRPLLNGLVFLYETIALHDLGLAIILLTVVIRLILFPLFQKNAHTQTVIQAIQPKIKEIQSRHKGNKEKEVQETLALYREHNVNPFSGFLFILVQLPILIALYHIFLRGLTPEALGDVYSFISHPAEVRATLFGLINLEKPHIILLGLTAAAQYIQGKISIPPKPPGAALSTQEQVARNMVYVGPVLTLVVFANFPAAASLYWFVSTLFSIGQQRIINKKLANGSLGNIHKKTD